MTNPKYRNTEPLTADYLRSVFHYSAATGVFTRIRQTSCAQKVGEVAKFKDDKGYLRIRIAGKLVTQHRLAWLYMTGEWPKLSIDHINGIRDDNRWENLREATPAQQCQNIKKLRTNASGYPGVSYHKPGKKWRAYISSNGKQRSLGYYRTKEEAADAYIKAKRAIHTFHQEVRDTPDNRISVPGPAAGRRIYNVSDATKAKLSAIRRRKFLHGIGNQRDERGCFIGTEKP